MESSVITIDDANKIINAEDQTLFSAIKSHLNHLEGLSIAYLFGVVDTDAFEALLERIWGDDVSPVGPTLFRHGLVFSVGLTLFPIVVAWLGYLVSAAQHLLR